MPYSVLTIEVDDATADNLRNLTRFWGVPTQEAVSRGPGRGTGLHTPDKRRAGPAGFSSVPASRPHDDGQGRAMEGSRP